MVTGEINVWFASGEHIILSNLCTRPFMDKGGREYNSVEHAYQSWKSGAFDEETYRKPWRHGSKYVGKLGTRTTNNWNLKLMDQLMFTSFDKNHDAMMALIDTGDTLITHTQACRFWRKQFPHLLMHIRAEYAEYCYLEEALYLNSMGWEKLSPSLEQESRDRLKLNRFYQSIVQRMPRRELCTSQ